MLSVGILLIGGLGAATCAQPAEQADVIFEAPSPVDGERFGAAVADVGDVDTDGTSDLLVGAAGATVQGASNAGRVFLLSGANGTVLHTIDSPEPKTNGRFGSAVAGIGDVTGDGTPDVAVGADGDSSRVGRAYLIEGADGVVLDTLTSPNATTDGLFAQSLAPITDVTADGVPDLVVAALGEDRVYLFDGATGTVHRTLTVETDDHAHFGHIAVPGDVSGDRTPDVLVGASSATVGERSGAGRAYLFDGRHGALLHTLTEPLPAHGGFGYLVAGPGDVNGDGTPDVAVGAAARTDGGTIYIYSGADGRMLRTVTPPAPDEDGYFGYSAVGMGDADGDGTAGLVLGTRVPVSEAEHAGQAYLITASGDRLRTFAGAEPDARFGSVVASATDPGEPSATAILVGAPAATADGVSKAGRVYRFSLP